MSRELCCHGHLWTPETTYINGAGSRVCLVCQRIRDAARRASTRLVGRERERQRLSRSRAKEIPEVLALRCPECLAIYRRPVKERNSIPHDCRIEWIA